jgi:hypothetical protein
MLFKEIAAHYCDGALFPRELIAIIAWFIYGLKYADCKDPNLLFRKTSVLQSHFHSRHQYYKGYDNRTGEKLAMKTFTPKENIGEVKEMLEAEKSLNATQVFHCRDSYYSLDALSVVAVYDYFLFTLDELLSVMMEDGKEFSLPENLISFILRKILTGLSAPGFRSFCELRPSSILFYPDGMIPFLFRRHCSGDIKVEMLVPELIQAASPHQRSGFDGLPHYLGISLSFSLFSLE